jgi:protein-tyrosine phosphatase
MTTRILMVCLGNICRSPTAEAAMRAVAADRGLDLHVESAGTAAYHVGNPPDPRSIEAGRAAGLDLGGAARQVRESDFRDFDLIVAMDRANLRDLRDRAPDDDARARVVLLRDHTDQPGTDVPDPYYGGDEGFAEVVRIVVEGAEGLADRLGGG